MSKPKIILASKDESYIVALEMKILEELNDVIDLELITDEGFFKEYFSQPQKAEILIMEEELCSDELQKHDIQSIFVLTEQQESERTDTLGTINIFKYMSVKEIYNQITMVSSGHIREAVQKSKETIVAVVYSPLGGCGKTTIALGLSACLAKNSKKVLYINAESINNFQYLMSNQSSIPGKAIGIIGENQADISKILADIIRKEEFDYLPPFGSSLSSLGLDVTVYQNIVNALRRTKEYDVIVVDTDTVFDSDKAQLITHANKVFLVLDHSKKAVFTINSLMKNMNCNDSDKYFFICNNTDDIAESMLLDYNIQPKFVVNEYVRNIADIEEMNFKDLGTETDLQRVAVLVI